MEKIINVCLNLCCSAVGATCLFIVSMAAGTMSLFGNYEPEMPSTLRPQESGEST